MSAVSRRCSEKLVLSVLPTGEVRASCAWCASWLGHGGRRDETAAEGPQQVAVETVDGVLVCHVMRQAISELTGVECVRYMVTSDRGAMGGHTPVRWHASRSDKAGRATGCGRSARRSSRACNDRFHRRRVPWSIGLPFLGDEPDDGVLISSWQPQPLPPNR